MKRVFMYSSRSLFGSGIKNLLEAEEELTVVGWETEAEEASQRVRELQPDVVLVITRGTPDCVMPDGKRLLKAGINTKIVELNLQDNSVCVYSGENLTINEITDLINVIEKPLNALPRNQQAITQKKEKRDY